MENGKKEGIFSKPGLATPRIIRACLPPISLIDPNEAKRFIKDQTLIVGNDLTRWQVLQARNPRLEPVEAVSMTLQILKCLANRYPTILGGE